MRAKLVYGEALHRPLAGLPNSGRKAKLATEGARKMGRIGEAHRLRYAQNAGSIISSKQLCRMIKLFLQRILQRRLARRRLEPAGEEVAADPGKIGHQGNAAKALKR